MSTSSEPESRLAQLQDWLTEHDFRCAKRFRERSRHNGSEEIELWHHLDSGRMIAIHLFDGAQQRGFELYVPSTGSTDIQDTFDATLQHLNDL